MTRATNAKRRGPSEITLTVLPRVDVPADRLTPKRGETVAAFVDRSGWAARGLPVICTIIENDKPRPLMRSEWGRKIKPSDKIAFLSQPLGGGGGGGSKSIGSLLAMVAVIALATLVAGPAGFLASAGFSATALAVTSALIIAGGSFLISHFLTPKSGAKGDEEDPLTISVGGNKARPQQPIPVHYGRLKFTPDFASPPWGDFRGDDQYFHASYCLGAGLFDIEEIGIGGVPVWTVADGTSPDFPTFKFEIAEPDEPITLFPANVAVAPDVSGQEISTTNLGPFNVNPPGSVGKQLFIDLIWPGGSFTMDGSNTRPATTNIIIEYRMIDDVGTPIGAGTWLTAINTTYTMEIKVPVRKTLSYTLPSAGRVQVRVRRTAAPSSTGANNTLWSGARLYLEGPTSRPKVTQLAIELRADKSLSQYNSQLIYVIATRKIPVWNGTAWVTQATQNPVWAAIDMWHDSDYGGGQSRDNIDLPTVAAKAADAATRGDTFNHRFSSETTVLDALTVILRSMLAQPVYVWDRFTLIRDEERALPRIQLTDFDIIRSSAALTFTLQDDQTSDGTIVEYLEEEIWGRADVPSTATLSELVHPARVQIEGVTNRRQATLIARYLAAVNRYRRITFSCDIEAEGKLLRRGDLVAVQTEMPGTLGQAFRVDSYDVATRRLTFHDAATWGGGNHYVRIKTPIGGSFGPVKVAKGTADNIAIIDATDLTTVQTQQSTTLAAVLARSDVSEPATLAFSQGTPLEFLGLVTRIANAGEGRFSIDLVNDAPEVYDINDSSVPALPDLPTLSLPAIPGALVPLYASLVQEGLKLTLRASWQPDPSSQSYTAQVSHDSGETWITVYPNGYESSFQVPGFDDRDLLLQVRGTSAAGANGPWTQATVGTPGLVLTTDALGIGLSPGTVDALSFASSLKVPTVVTSLPSPIGYLGNDLVFLTTDRKLYSYLDATDEWVPSTDAVPGPDSISTGMIQAGAIAGDVIAANAIQAVHLDADAVTADKIAADAVTADKLAANSITAANGAIADLTVTTIKIGDNAVTIPLAASSNTSITGNSAEQTVVTLTFTLDQDSYLQIMAMHTINFSGGATATQQSITRLYVDGGTAVDATSQGSFSSPPKPFVLYLTPTKLSAGSHTVHVTWFAANVLASINRRLVITGFKK